MINRSRLMALCAALSLSAVGSASAAAVMTAAGPLAGSQIDNVATFSGQDVQGTAYTRDSAVVSATVAHVPALSITPNQSGSAPAQRVYAFPLGTADLPYILQNTSNGPDSFTLSFTSPAELGSALLIDTNKNGFDGSDPRITSGTYSVTLQPGETVNLLLRSTIPDADPAKTVRQLNVTGEVMSGLVVDTDNMSEVETGTVLAYTFDGAANAFVPSPGTVDSTRVLLNNGNAPLDADAFFNFLHSGYGAPATAATTITWSFDASNFYASPQAAWNAYLVANPGGVPQNGSAVLTMRSTVESGLPDRTVLTNTLSSYLAVSSNTMVRNDDSATSTNTATVTVSNPVLSVSKSQKSCAADGSGNWNCGFPTTAPINLRPCDVIGYQVIGINNGSGALAAARISDQINADLWTKSARARSSAAGSALVRLNGSGPWLPIITNAPLGALIEAGFDSNGDSMITAADLLPAGQTLILDIDTQLQGPGCDQNSPVNVVDSIFST